MRSPSVKQKIFRLAIFFLVGIFFIPATASAFRQGPGKCERGMGKPMKMMQWSSLHIWNNPEIVDKLALSDEQIARLKEADFAMRENHLELRSELNRLNLGMERAFSDKPVNNAEILEMANKMAEIRNKLFVDRIESRLKMVEILNDEQLEKLDVLRSRPGDDRRKFGKSESGYTRIWKKDMIQ